MLQGSSQTHPITRMLAAAQRQSLSGWLCFTRDESSCVALGLKHGLVTRVAHLPAAPTELETLLAEPFSWPSYGTRMEGELPAELAEGLLIEGLSLEPAEVLARAHASQAVAHEAEVIAQKLAGHSVQIALKQCPSALYLEASLEDAFMTLAGSVHEAQSLTTEYWVAVALASLFGALSVDPVAAVAVPEPAAPRLSPKAQQQLDLLEVRIAAAAQGPAALLDVADDADEATVQQAFMGWVKRLHPDRFAGELAAHKRDATELFRQLSEARDHLLTGHAEEENASEEAEVARQLDAAMELQRAEVYLRRNRVGEARAAVEAILKAQPEHIEAQQMQVRMELLRDDLAPDALEQMLKRVNAHAADGETPSMAMLELQGRLLMRLHRQDEALTVFKAISLREPSHIEAQRVLRIASMRAAKQDKSDGRGGWLGRLSRKR